MTEAEINTAAEEFAALPKAERKATFFSLPAEVRPVARAIVEERRGITRDKNGQIVMSKDLAVKTLVRYAHKSRDLEARKANLDTRTAEVRAQLQATHGDEALAEAEQAIVDSFATPAPAEEQAAE